MENAKKNDGNDITIGTITEEKELYHFSKENAQLGKIYRSSFERSFLSDIQKYKIRNDRQNLLQYIMRIYVFIFEKWYYLTFN